MGRTPAADTTVNEWVHGERQPGGTCTEPLACGCTTSFARLAAAAAPLPPAPASSPALTPAAMRARCLAGIVHFTHST